MSVKIIRSIFRLDYQLSYKLLDHLGEQLEDIITKTKKNPFSNVAGDIDTARHAIRAHGNVGDGKFTLNLSLNSFDGTIENKAGYEINRFHKSPVFDLANDIIGNLNLKAFNRYERIGFRSFILITGEKVKFEPALQYFKKSNETLVGLISKNFAEVDDAAVTLESHSEDLGNIRLALGPYGERDERKFFSVAPEEKEGLIVDIDWWESKVEIQKLKISETIKNCQEIYDEIMGNIENIIF